MRLFGETQLWHVAAALTALYAGLPRFAPQLLMTLRACFLHGTSALLPYLPRLGDNTPVIALGAATALAYTERV